MKKIFLSFFLFLFFAAAWFGRYQSVNLSAVYPTSMEVEVKGEVKNPGTYTIKWKGSVKDAIAAAGGLTEDSALDDLNQNKTLSENEIVVIRKKAEEEKLQVSLNTASQEEFEALPGIGPAIASRIVEYRTNHTFNSIEQIMEVKGIGEKMFERIKEYLVL